MRRALYRKYRSKSLDEIVGQRHITDILRRAIATDRIAHAYLLTGPRGVGKTSIARILAHEINQLPYSEESTHLDIIEIDAASNNGVDDVRELREKAQVAPVSAKRKIYIIDEVHMLSRQAFNALLKTLEEPPEHVVFILATTDVDKLPATIISRVQRYTFRTISTDEVVAHLRSIADKEQIAITDEALKLIARHGEGSFRDSISLLDQLSSLKDSGDEIAHKDVELALGLATDAIITELINAYDAGDVASIVRIVDTFEQQGTAATVAASQLISYSKSRIVEHPHYLELIESLLDIGYSSYPYIKLLSALTARADRQQIAPVVASVPQSAPVTPKRAPVKAKQAASLPKTPAVKHDEPSKPTPKPKAKKAASTLSNFDWQVMIDYTREHSVAILSILSKAGYEIDGTTLKIYAGKTFAKNKLDDPRYRPKLIEAVRHAGGEDLDVETIATAAPPKDSQAAAIVAMMGGGEEVNVSE